MTELQVDRLLPDGFLASALRRDALAGLTAVPKTLPPKWFYDERGSELFEKITLLPEYYPTRAERSILAAHAADVATATGASQLNRKEVGLDSVSGRSSRLQVAGAWSREAKIRCLSAAEGRRGAHIRNCVSNSFISFMCCSFQATF